MDLASRSARFVYDAVSFLTLPLPFRAHAVFARRIFASSLPLLAQMKSGSGHSGIAAPFAQVSAGGVSVTSVGRPDTEASSGASPYKDSYTSSVCFFMSVVK
jgi:hypothetical protein